MSLTADDRQNIWQDHRDSLTRIRTQLSTSPIVKSRSPVRSPVRTPVRSPGGRATGRQSHSPYGKYRQSTPPYLPRLDRTPEHEKQKIRGNRYEVVPPVNRRSTSRPEDYDSWGEESDEDSEDEQVNYMPQPYPYQPYPMGPPPPVVFGAPFPVYYPPQPNLPKRGKRSKKGAREADVYRVQSPPRGSKAAGRYEDVNQSFPPRASKQKKQNRVHFQPQNGYYAYPAPAYSYPAYPFQSLDDMPSQKKSKRYKYIHPRDTPYSPAEEGSNVYKRFKDEPLKIICHKNEKKDSELLFWLRGMLPLLDRLVYYYFKDHPLFAENVSNWFVNECVEDFIPDILIEVLNELDRMEIPSVVHEVRDGVVREVTAQMTHSLVRETVSEMVDEYMLFKDTNKDPLEGFLDRLVTDAVAEATTDIVKETVREMAREYVDDKHVVVFFDDLFYDFMESIGTELVEESLFDMIAEEFIEHEVIEPELEEEVPEVAKEVLSHYDSRVMRRELKQVSSHAGDQLMESIVLDYLLTLLARQGHVWTESDYANRHMDDMINSILLERMFTVTQTRRKTTNNRPLRKLHQKVVTDVALDVLLQQLTATLDEDLLDVDEFERGITEPASSFNTPAKTYS